MSADAPPRAPAAPRLLPLLPAVHRERDGLDQGPLHDLVEALHGPLQAVHDAADRLYADAFIETCADWAVPYIADLLDVRGLPEVAAAAPRRRAWVAGALQRRARKGTARGLAEMALAVTDWHAAVAAGHERVAWHQHLAHQRIGPAWRDGRHPPMRPTAATLHLRDPVLLSRLGGPFDTAARTVDLRPPGPGQGWSNHRRVGLFLWTLGVQEVEGADAVPSAAGRHAFHISPLGNPAPLFTRPRADAPAPEGRVPHPLSVPELARDLAGPPLRPEGFEPGTLHYGRGRSLHLERRDDAGTGKGGPIPAEAIAARDLSTWERPGTAWRGLLSGPHAGSWPAWPGGPYALQATIGTETRTVRLARAPASLADACDVLEAALRTCGGSEAFGCAQVAPVADRILVLPGRAGATATVQPAGGDGTAQRLKLTAADQATQRLGLLGTPTAGLGPGVAATQAAVRIDGLPAVAADAGPRPATPIQAAQRLEQALRARTGDARTADARVVAWRGRLLVVPGAPADRVWVEDGPAARELGLLHQVAVDPVLGRVTFALGDEPAGLRASFLHGAPAPIGAGDHDRRARAAGRTPTPGEADTVAEPQAYGVCVGVGGPSPQHATVGAALAATAGQPKVVIEIRDDRTYAESLAIDLGTREVVLQSANLARPVLRGDLLVRGATDGRFTLSGVLLEGRLTVEGARIQRKPKPAAAEPGNARIQLRDCTLVPGRALGEDGRPKEPGAPSLVVTGEAKSLRIDVRRCVTGPLRVPDDLAGLSLEDSILDDAVHDPQAEVGPALVGARASLPAPPLPAAKAPAEPSPAATPATPALTPAPAPPPPAAAPVPPTAREETATAPAKPLATPLIARPRLPLRPGLFPVPPKPATPAPAPAPAAAEPAPAPAPAPPAAPAPTPPAAPAPPPPAAASPARKLVPLGEVAVTLGPYGPATVPLPLTRLEEAADLLTAVMQGLWPRQTGLQPFVAVVGDRLVAVGPVGGEPAFRDAGGSDAATRLGLTRAAGARRAFATVGAPLPDPLPARTAAPSLRVEPSGAPGATATLQGVPADPADAAARLQAALRAQAAASPPLGKAEAFAHGRRLVLLSPPDARVGLWTGAAPADPAGVRWLGLAAPAAAVGPSPAGDLPGPRLRAERCTAFGPVRVVAADVSECLFAAPLVVLRRQVGCARFTYLAPGSRAPRRFRCVGGDADHDAPPPPPVFRARAYGDPHYARLDAATPAAVARGAEDGAELGAYNLTKAALRLASLREQLADHVPAGLEHAPVLVT